MVLNKPLRKTKLLENNSRILILGGGAAGSFFAIHLLREAKKIGKDVQVTIIDQRIIYEPDKISLKLKGCNSCAGVISPRLYNGLVKTHIKPPCEIICEEFTHIWLHGLWKNFPLKVPSGQKLCSVFRGSLPYDRENCSQGFDTFLLKKAVEEGASIMPGIAQAIQYTPSRRPCLIVKTGSGEIFSIESDFLCISTGINASKNIKENLLFNSYQKINPPFKPPEARPTLVVEIKPGRDYLKKYMNKELYLIVSGSKILGLEHIALVPKGDYLTIALVGESIDRASLPEETGQIIRAFLSIAHIQAILPRLDNTPIACACNPFMAVTPSKNPFENRISMVGDALGARLYRDGLYSAFVSAQSLAHTVVHKGVDKKSLEHANNWVLKWLEKDNRYGKIVFGLVQNALKSRILSRILYQTFATEMKSQRMGKWPMGNVLWKIGSGSADYENLIGEIFSPRVFSSFLTGAFKTFRNVFTEMFFGLNWGTYGRYPVVILKGKRDYIKQSIQASLGIKLDDAPEMERMYAIKIRASSMRIFEELGKFGEAGARFLRLRFVDVKRICGLPNQVGSIVRYCSPIIPISMDIRLVRSIPGKTLLYEPQELFTKQGILLFDITPTKDGNNRLVIYTAFDFRKGRGGGGRLFFKLFKLLFPDYAHDVVWNHAICCIKAEAEGN